MGEIASNYILMTRGQNYPIKFQSAFSLLQQTCLHRTFYGKWSVKDKCPLKRDLNENKEAFNWNLSLLKQVSSQDHIGKTRASLCGRSVSAVGSHFFSEGHWLQIPGKL